MSVMIYGTEKNSEDFPGLIVSGEKTFYSLWIPVIKELNLKYIGDQKWIYKRDLSLIISEFQNLFDYSYKNPELSDIAYHCRNIIDNLANYWEISAPLAERLWIG